MEQKNTVTRSKKIGEVDTVLWTFCCLLLAATTAATAAAETAAAAAAVSTSCDSWRGVGTPRKVHPKGGYQHRDGRDRATEDRGSGHFPKAG